MGKSFKTGNQITKMYCRSGVCQNSCTAKRACFDGSWTNERERWVPSELWLKRFSSDGPDEMKTTG